MNIVLYHGIKSYRRLNPLPHLVQSFQDAYLRAHILPEKYDYDFWDIAKMRKIIDAGVEKYDTGEPIILGGHSMGGLFACAMAHRFVRSPVLGVVTIFTPHRSYRRQFSTLLDADRDLKVPVVTFSAQYDRLVRARSSTRDGAINIAPFPISHVAELVASRRWTDEIARITKKYIREPDE